MLKKQPNFGRCGCFFDVLNRGLSSVRKEWGDVKLEFVTERMLLYSIYEYCGTGCDGRGQKQGEAPCMENTRSDLVFCESFWRQHRNMGGDVFVPS